MKKILSIVMIVMILTVVGCSNNQVVDDIYDNVETEGETTGKETATAETTATEVEEVVEESEPVDIKVITPYGTPALSLVKMMVDNPEIAENVMVTYEAVQATDVLTTTLINHEADIAIVPTNLAAVLQSKEVGYKLVGPSVWGIFYLVSSEDISSIQDLKGKTISTFGRNLTPDGVLNYILSEKGLTVEEDVMVEYFSGSSELATNYISGESTLAMIPQPLLTNVLMKRDDSKVVIDLQEAWSEVTGQESYPQASLIVSAELIESHPEVVEKFMAEYDLSVDWVNENPADAGTYYEQLNIGLNAMLVEQAIPECNLDFVPTEEARESLDAYLNVLFDFNPQLVGGKAVDEALYFEK